MKLDAFLIVIISGLFTLGMSVAIFSGEKKCNCLDQDEITKEWKHEMEFLYQKHAKELARCKNEEL